MIPDGNGNVGSSKVITPRELSAGEKAKRWIGNTVDEVLHLAEGIPGEGVVVGGATRLGKAALALEKSAEVSATAEKILAAERIGSGLKGDVKHLAASFLSKEQLAAGQVFDLKGGGGGSYKLLQTYGELSGKKGVYEYILDTANRVTHQRFIEGGVINGAPNQKVAR